MADEHVCSRSCARYKNGKCGIRAREQARTSRTQHLVDGKCPSHWERDVAPGKTRCAECLANHNKHSRDSMIRSGNSRRVASVVGRLAELLVVHDLDNRKIKWYLPDQLSNAKEDVFMRTSLGWYSGQVKTGQDYRKKDGTFTSNINCKRTDVDADILILVSRASRTIQYRAWNKPLPPELPSEPAPIPYLEINDGQIHGVARDPESRQVA